MSLKIRETISLVFSPWSPSTFSLSKEHLKSGLLCRHNHDLMVVSFVLVVNHGGLKMDQLQCC